MNSPKTQLIPLNGQFTALDHQHPQATIGAIVAPYIT